MKHTVLAFLIIFGVIVSSCESENTFFSDIENDAIIGIWSRTDKIPSGKDESDYRYFDMVFTYKFNKDLTYSYQVDFYGFEDENPEEITGQSKNTGFYEVRGDSIFITAEELTYWVDESGEERISKKLYGSTYGNRFEINTDKLTLFYISYPADAPLQSQMTYLKIN